MLSVDEFGEFSAAMGVAIGQAAAFCGMYLTLIIKARRFLRDTATDPDAGMASGSS